LAGIVGGTCEAQSAFVVQAVAPALLLVLAALPPSELLLDPPAPLLDAPAPLLDAPAPLLDAEVPPPDALVLPHALACTAKTHAIDRIKLFVDMVQLLLRCFSRWHRGPTPLKDSLHARLTLDDV